MYEFLINDEKPEFEVAPKDSWPILIVDDEPIVVKTIKKFKNYNDYCKMIRCKCINYDGIQKL